MTGASGARIEGATKAAHLPSFGAGTSSAHADHQHARRMPEGPCLLSAVASGSALVGGTAAEKLPGAVQFIERHDIVVDAEWGWPSRPYVKPPAWHDRHSKQSSMGSRSADQATLHR